MVHDGLCERDNAVARWICAGCQCASRAYARDPLPEPDWTPIWARNTEDE